MVVVCKVIFVSNPAAVLRLCCCWGCDKKRKSVTETDRQNKNYFRNAIFHETLYFCLALSGTGCPINTLDLIMPTYVNRYLKGRSEPI